MTAAIMNQRLGRRQTRIAVASGWIGSALEDYDFLVFRSPCHSLR